VVSRRDPFAGGNGSRAGTRSTAVVSLPDPLWSRSETRRLDSSGGTQAAQSLVGACPLQGSVVILHVVALAAREPPFPVERASPGRRDEAAVVSIAQIPGGLRRSAAEIALCVASAVGNLAIVGLLCLRQIASTRHGTWGDAVRRAGCPSARGRA
jgi:hypothetical protein